MSCEEIKKLINQPNLQCCSSCHEDYREGYSELIDIYDKNNNYIGMACCIVANEYKDSIK
jgi:hypothetical protein